MAAPIRVVGVSARGRNRLREHGDRWVAVRFGNPQCFDGRDGVLLESETTGYRRWVKVHGDQHFRIGA